jgi:phage replication O-like protein O
MANPQVEEGYVKIANELQEAFCRTRIPGEERQVLDVIIRKTYGWNKCEDAISLSQFVLMTGINKPCVIRAIQGLLSKKIISVIKKDNEPVKLYKFNKDYHQWQPLSKKITLSKKIIGVIQKDNLSLSKKIPTKDTIKDTVTNDNIIVVNAEALRLAELLFSEIIKENPKSRLLNQNGEQKSKTIAGWAKDIEKLIRLDRQEPSTVGEVILFATHDNFWGANILSGKKLRDKWDTLTKQMFEKQKEIRPYGKHHRHLKEKSAPFSDIPPALLGN